HVVNICILKQGFAQLTDRFQCRGHLLSPLFTASLTEWGWFVYGTCLDSAHTVYKNDSEPRRHLEDYNTRPTGSSEKVAPDAYRRWLTVHLDLGRNERAWWEHLMCPRASSKSDQQPSSRHL